ncbi:hypothetical protein GCM10010523_03390 [Paenarthrobacter ilicis]
MHAQVRLHKWNLSCVYGVNSAFTDVHADDLDAVGGKDRSSWEANVSKTDDGNAINCIQCISPFFVG